MSHFPAKQSFRVLAIATLAAIGLLAQYGRGVILGTITDASGAVVPGLKVAATNNATNESREVTSDANGNYQFNALLSGLYTVSAAGASFKTSTASKVELRVNSQVRIDIAMQLGGVTEKIQVESTAPQLQTNTAVMGTVIDNRTMIELPLNSRNFFDLAALTPGSVRVASGSSVMDQRSIEIGGVRNTSTNATLDGVDFSIANVNNPAIALSLDAIQEFKVQTNFMDASYGYGAAGIDMVSKRGTNAFHGVVYDFVRNRTFQAGQFFRPPSGAPRFTYNQFGGNAGGKIIKDKLFLFGNYEARRRRTGTILQGLIPTEAMKRGDFSAVNNVIRDPANAGLPFPNRIIPAARFDRLTNSLIPFFPTPNFSGRPGVNFLVTPSNKERRDQATGRADYLVSPRGSLFGRYSFADNSLGDAAYRVGKGLIRPDRTQNMAVGYTHTGSANLISETRLGFTKAYLARTSDGDRFSKNYAAELGLKNLGGVPGDFTEPSVNLTEYAPGNPTGAGGFVGYGLRIVQNNIYYRVAETITYIRGRHSLKFGGDVNRLMVGYDQGSNQNGILNFANNFTGDSFGDFLLGHPLSAQGGLGSIGDFGGVAKYAIGTRYQAFLQDDWKLTDRLTLNLGLRYEVFQNWRGRLANFDLGLNRQLLAGQNFYYEPGTGLVGTSSPALPERPIVTDKNNFMPRVGLAYRLGQRTVIRSGIGVFSLLNTGGATLNGIMSTVPFFVQANLISSSTTPTLVASNLFPTAAQAAGTVGSHNDLNRRDGYMYSYNFNIQHQLTPTLLLETGYMGNTGHKQVGAVYANQPRLPANPAAPEPFAARVPYPRALPTFTETTNYQWSNYNAWFIKMEQRLWHGLSVTSHYTWAKLIDAAGPGQNMYNRRAERGLADTDIRHNFIAGYVYDLPVGKGRAMDLNNGVANAVLGGWQLNGIANMRTGAHYTIGTVGDIANVATGGQRANTTGAAPSKLDPRTSGLLGLDRSAYVLPARGSFGNLSRNTQPGFGINNWDMSAAKNFGVPFLGEAGRLQLRFEWFNVFNHTQFVNPNATFNTPTFGLVTSAFDPRILQIAGRLHW